MTLKLSTLSIALGLGMGLPQIYGILKPSAFAAAVRKFPRSVPWGVALMLLAKLMVDTGRPLLPVTHWTWVIQTWAYVLVVAGIWLTLYPWRLRDLLNWATATEDRVRFGSAARLAFGLFVAALGLLKF